MKDMQLEYLDDLIGLVSAENQRQLRKWGVQEHDPSWWMTIITEEVGELAEALLEFNFGDGPTNHVAREAIQVATVALKVAEGFIAWPAERSEKEPMTFGSKHEGCRRQYVQLSRAWYGKNFHSCLDAFSIGFYHPHGGTTGEFSVVWVDLEKHGFAPRLEVFNDAWDALWQFRDVLEKMAEVDGQDISPEAFCELLKSCGVEDATPVERPK